MKARVRLVHTVTMFVEGESEDAIQDWLNEHTPEGAVQLALKQNGSFVRESYDEEILAFVSNNEAVDYVIGKERDDD